MRWRPEPFPDHRPLCWSAKDGTIEQCCRVGVTDLGLCAEHHVEICGTLEDRQGEAPFAGLPLSEIFSPVLA